MIDNRDDTFLARWLNNELTREELEEFQASPEYVHYQKLVKGTEAIQSERIDEERILANIKATRGGNSENRSATKIRQLWVYGLAASIALIIGFFVFLNWEVTMESGYGEQLAFTLPDNSQVILNANSEAVYNKRNWQETRELSLKGEAFFKVRKGSTFTVGTGMGKVTVLGTQFNVRFIDGLFEVTCYEGKVSVSQQGNDHILLPGNTFRKVGPKVELFSSAGRSNPSWMEGESTFKSMPVEYVLKALENQFDVEFEGEPTESQLLFTGSFPHDDLEVALKIVLGSLQIDYTLRDDKVILESKL